MSLKYARLSIDLFNNFKRRKSLNLEEILSTVQEAWKGPKTLTSSDSKLDMETIFNNKSLVMKEACPMNHRRRRLSVPEIIMRKHTLAQEHSGSQESKYYDWSNDTQCLSDPNLSRKKDFNIIRKSTLLRRLWGDSNKSKIMSGSFQEWQYSYKNGSSIKSLNSNHSSPEHLPKYMRDTTSPRRKPSSSPNQFSAKKNGDNESTTNSPQRKMTIIDNTSLKSGTKPPFSRESTTKYTCSSFTNLSDSNSDSAYTNSISNFTNVVNASSKNSENQNRSELESSLSRVSFQETAVQTRDVANLNVISNVNLSQSTLDLIFKEVMKDVSKLTPGEMNISSAMVTCDDQTAIMVNQMPCVSLKTTPDSDCTVLTPDRANREQFIISNVRTGSPYIKPTENVQTAIPRFSAIPRTSSMEVNTSEEDKDESDTASFVDSLEDFSSPRVPAEDCRSSSDISQLLPEGKKYISPNKSSTFYIPIKVASDNEVKAVSEFLPVKVRERLVQRQQKREEKCRQFKSVSALKISESVSEIKSNLGLKKYMPKKRTKPVLPSIESLKKLPNEKNYPLKSSFTERKSSQLSKAMDNAINKSENVKSEPRKIYRRTTQENAEKRIEILEIMECIEIPSEKGQKSKIPIPINNTSNKKVNVDKPSYLDLDNYVSDQNVDQLIANILIDSLNHDVNSCNSDKKNANLSEQVIPVSDCRYVHKFDVISEETAARRRNPEDKKNNNDILRQPNENYTRSVINKKLEQKDVSSIPKGWVTLYTVHKDTETPESTSDEGKQYLDTNDVKEVTRPFANVDAATKKNNSAKSNLTISDSKPEYKNDYVISSNNDENTIFESTLLDRPVRKFGKYLRKSKMNCREKPQNYTKEDWSVTVSGTNSFGQMAPDVEMRLKFPNKFMPFNQNHSESRLEEKNIRGKRCNFPKIGNDRSSPEKQKKVRKQRSIDECLPKIQTAHNRNKKIDDSVISMGPSVIIPRQTKTSRNRYHFSRPREGFSVPGVPSILNEREYYEILRRIPDILAVTGRSISSEGKSFER